MPPLCMRRAELDMEECAAHGIDDVASEAKNMKSSPAGERRATYQALSSFFVTSFAGFAFYEARRGKDLDIKPFDLVQLALASYRLGRMVSYDKVFEPYRAPFTRTVPDPSGEGMTVVSKGSGRRQAIGELIACPICAGTWISAGLVYGLALAPRIVRPFLAIMSSIGAAELLDAATEALQWTGQLAREQAGTDRSAKGQPGEHTAHNHFSGSRLQALPANTDLRRRDERSEHRKSPAVNS
jgi:hypothetical protein